MPIVGGLDIHRKQLTFDYLDTATGEVKLIHRLLAGRCELCEGTEGLEVHHVRKLADLNKPGRRDKPPWMELMAKRRRKTLVICRRCHEDIHAGRATKPYPK